MGRRWTSASVALALVLAALTVADPSAATSIKPPEPPYQGFKLPDGAFLRSEWPGVAGATAKSDEGVAADGAFLVADAMRHCGDIDQLTRFDPRAIMQKAEAGPWMEFIAPHASLPPVPSLAYVPGVTFAHIEPPQAGGPRVEITFRVEASTTDLERGGRARLMNCAIVVTGLDPAPLLERLQEAVGLPIPTEPDPASAPGERKVTWWAVPVDGKAEPLPGAGPADSLEGLFERAGPGKPVLLVSYSGWKSPLASRALIAFTLYRPGGDAAR